jgi:hypothetical protein
MFLSTLTFLILYGPLLCVATPYKYQSREVDLKSPEDSDPANPILPLANEKSRPQVNPFAGGLPTAPSACDDLFNSSNECQMTLFA